MAGEPLGECSASTPQDGAAAEPSLEQQLASFLRSREVPCPVCRYNLRGLTSARCPECGRGLTLSVGATEPYLRAWITMVVPLCASAGIGLLPVLLIAIQFAYGGGPSAQDMKAILVLVGWAIASIPLAIAALAARRRFVRLRPGVQWALAAAGLTIMVGGMFSFFFILRVYF